MWPTPRACEDEGGVVKNVEYKNGSYSRKNKQGVRHGIKLKDAVHFQNDKKMWPTPRAANPGSRPNGKGGKILAEEVAIAEGVRERGKELYPTPTEHGNYNRKGLTKTSGDGLATAVKKLYPTPIASDYKGVGPLDSKSHKYMLDKKYLCATIQEEEQITGQLNPNWVEWLMGYPTGWTDIKCDMPKAHDGFNEEPVDIPRLVTGIKDRAVRLKGLGNAVMPEIPEIIGKYILEIENA